MLPTFEPQSHEALSVQIHLKDRGVKHIKISEAQKVYQVYEFIQQIGHGSFGVVVLAIEKNNNKHWAIKIVNKTIAGASKLTEIGREIKILKLVNHPNIIYLDKVYESPKKIYMVLELCKKGLNDVYLQKRPFSEKVSKNIFIQLVNAIWYLHKNDIVHRDVKMDNILIANNPDERNDEYYIKLTDFGLSVVKTGVGIESFMTDYCGTVTYMPPEIIEMKTYSELCDVWAIGVILYMMLFGKLPFGGFNEDEIKRKICTEEPHYDKTGVNSEAIDLLRTILEKDPVQRVTAAQIKEHPWVDKRAKIIGKDQNIVQLMKRFRSELDRGSNGSGKSVRGLLIFPEYYHR
ncbi:serine/threonine-protein kinase 33-like isoform X2 [Cylas formicarius]|uniref:serine/threonine-protein kinase 33-like isoform X2 n=1 Tax=Cylas formicarius TaxID=197179 RepID=UPI002958DA57|nr:serine/threonine-protein kinase 33-like isoform X2 [Cylas formicarius]